MMMSLSLSLSLSRFRSVCLFLRCKRVHLRVIIHPPLPPLHSPPSLSNPPDNPQRRIADQGPRGVQKVRHTETTTMRRWRLPGGN